MRFVSYVLVSFFVGAIPTFLFVWLGERFVEDSSTLLISYALLVVLTVIPLLLMRHITRLLENLSKRPTRDEAGV